MASLRQRPSQAKVLSTTRLRGKTLSGFLMRLDNVFAARPKPNRSTRQVREETE